MPKWRTTAGVAAHERPDYWRQLLHEVFLADCRVEPVGQAEFHADMSVSRVGDVGLVDISGAAFKSLRHGSADPARKFALLQLDGYCIVRAGTREIQLNPGDLCMLPDGCDMGIERPDAFRHISISFPANVLKDTRQDSQILSLAKVETRIGAAAVFTAAIRQLLTDHESIDASSRQVIGDSIVGLLKAALSAYVQSPHAPSAAQTAAASGLAAFYKQSVRRHVFDNLSNPALSVDLIAKGVGLSPRYVHRLFAGDGYTLMEWVWIQRLECAAKDLAATSHSRRPIGSIAYSWGFNDQAHFSRSFRKYFNVPPRDYRDGSRHPKA
jgi:AraC-like DNA-binding protein